MPNTNDENDEDTTQKIDPVIEAIAELRSEIREQSAVLRGQMTVLREEVVGLRAQLERYNRNTTLGDRLTAIRMDLGDLKTVQTGMRKDLQFVAARIEDGQARLNRVVRYMDSRITAAALESDQRLEVLENTVLEPKLSIAK